ncbi:MAG: glycosyltransferase family 2 protein [Xanthomonadales bacterium]|nr:glycosyltransferase family 2 protein [Xanthomonadales bacterium]
MSATPVPHTGADDFVSVVMPAFDAQATIAASIESVLAQTHQRLELVVVDDGSRDATAALAEALAARDARVVVLRQANAGVAAARNAGIDAARGDCIAFLDSDDRWHPRKLERQLAGMRAAGARVSYTAYRRVDAAGRVLSTVLPPVRIDHAALLRSNHIGNLTGLYDRRLGDARFRRIGHEDYVFWLDLVRRAGEAVRADDGEPLADYLVRDGSVSANKWRAARWQWRIYREVEGLSLARAAALMLAYVRHALAKRR